MIQHDAAPGKLERCQITGSSNLNLVIDLGHQPPCDSLLTAEMLDKPEKTYPLRLMHCPDSGLAQLDYVSTALRFITRTIPIGAASRGHSSITSVLSPIV
jgi:Putative zinc binding domain